MSSVEEPSAPRFVKSSGHALTTIQLLMGGAVSHGVDNNDLIDKLCEAGYVRSPDVTFALRAVDRALYFPEGRESLAYRDLAYKNGDVHLSAPCIYCEVLEGLELSEGLSFLNIGSGTGYLSTVAGLILSANGTNHGIEICNNLVEFAEDKMQLFLEKCMPNIFGVEFCNPAFVQGNGLCLNPCYRQYDRVYCGAAVSVQYEDYMKSLVKVGGILVMPFGDKLLKICKISEMDYEETTLLPVSFAPLILPRKEDKLKAIDIASNPRTLQSQCRTIIRCLLGVKNLQNMVALKLPLPKPILQYLLYQ